MWTRRLLIAVAVLALAAAAAWSASNHAPGKRLPNLTHFPDGEGKALTDGYCVICHSAELVTQQAKDSTGWEKTLAQMEKWGIKPTPAEHDSLRRYLLSHFGPRAR
jgi:cytochrome c5